MRQEIRGQVKCDPGRFARGTLNLSLISSVSPLIDGENHPSDRGPARVSVQPARSGAQHAIQSDWSHPGQDHQCAIGLHDHEAFAFALARGRAAHRREVLFHLAALVHIGHADLTGRGRVARVRHALGIHPVGKIGLAGKADRQLQRHYSGVQLSLNLPYLEWIETVSRTAYGKLLGEPKRFFTADYRKEFPDEDEDTNVA